MLTDVSEKHITSIFKVENKSRKKHSHMKVICSYETSVNVWSTRFHIPEDGNIHNYRCGNLKFHNPDPLLMKQCPKSLLIERAHFAGNT
jgi:hypothetical protein